MERSNLFVIAACNKRHEVLTWDAKARCLSLSALAAFFLLIVVPICLAQQNVARETAQSDRVATQESFPDNGGGSHVQLEGEFQVIYEDFKGQARTLYSLKLSDGTRVPLQFVKDPPKHILTGDHVRVDGDILRGTLILYSGSTNVQTTKTQSPPTSSSGPVPNTFGPQSTLVILVNFQDAPVQPYSLGDAQNVVFGTVNDFFKENSYGQTSLTGTVVGWYTIPDSITTCNTGQIATDANNAAAAAGVKLSNYTRYVYMFPSDNACPFAGSSTVGGSPSQTWVNGSPDVHVISHELGHAFGLMHSHLLDCGTSTTICSSGNVIDYGDLLDTMGVPQTAAFHYNAFQKERLGWLNYGVSPSIQTVQASGTYTINAYEVGSPGPNALKILKSTNATTGAKTWYYIEARQAIGFDAFLTSSTCLTCYAQNETNGVLFHIGTDGDANSSDLLDMTPSTPTSSGWFDPSLMVGQRFQDSAAGVTITPTAVTSTGATVQITMSGPSCAAASPTVAISQSQSVMAGTAVSFTVSVNDNDSSACSSSSFKLADSLTSGWTSVWSTTALSLSPGKSSSAMLTVTSPPGTADGTYNVGVSATNASMTSYTGLATAIYVISTPVPPTMSLNTSQSSYLPGQTVAINISLLSGTLPDAGASVKVKVTSPGGKSTTLTGTTGSNGLALLNYKLSKSAAAGTYQVQATTTTGASPTTASTTFTVQ